MRCGVSLFQNRCSVFVFALGDRDRCFRFKNRRSITRKYFFFSFSKLKFLVFMTGTYDIRSGNGYSLDTLRRTCRNDVHDEHRSRLSYWNSLFFNQSKFFHRSPFSPLVPCRLCPCRVYRRPTRTSTFISAPCSVVIINRCVHRVGIAGANLNARIGNANCAWQMSHPEEFASDSTAITATGRTHRKLPTRAYLKRADVYLYTHVTYGPFIAYITTGIRSLVKDYYCYFLEIFRFFFRLSNWQTNKSNVHTDVVTTVLRTNG